jgi:hypothetical protein
VAEQKLAADLEKRFSVSSVRVIALISARAVRAGAKANTRVAGAGGAGVMAESLVYFNQQWVGDHNEEWFRQRDPSPERWSTR